MISEKVCIVSDDRRLSEIFKEHTIIITKLLDLKPSHSTTTSLPKILKLLAIILASRSFLLCKGRSVGSSFIL